MSYAANLGRNRILELLRSLGAEDVQYPFERASLQGQIETARLLHSMGARPVRGSVMGPCETQNPEGLTFLLKHGAEITDQHGDRLAPVALVLETHCRNSTGEHRCLELLAQQGIELQTRSEPVCLGGNQGPAGCRWNCWRSTWSDRSSSC